MAVEALKLSARKNVQVLAQLAKTASDLAGCKYLDSIGGAEGDRTPDLRIANAALSQLS